MYFPDLTTRASLAEIDSVDLVALDFFVGAMAVVALAVGLSDCRPFVLYSTNDQGLNSEYTM